MKSRQIYSVDSILNMIHDVSVKFLPNYISSFKVIDDRLIAPYTKQGLNHVCMCCELFRSMKGFYDVTILYQITSIKIAGNVCNVYIA